MASILVNCSENKKSKSENQKIAEVSNEINSPVAEENVATLFDDLNKIEQLNLVFKETKEYPKLESQKLMTQEELVIYFNSVKEQSLFEDSDIIYHLKNGMITTVVNAKNSSKSIRVVSYSNCQKKTNSPDCLIQSLGVGRYYSSERVLRKTHDIIAADKYSYTEQVLIEKYGQAVATEQSITMLLSDEEQSYVVTNRISCSIKKETCKDSLEVLRVIQ